MFKNNDRLTLSLINARDINGNILPLSLTLPLKDNEFHIPEEVVAIDIFEYQEGTTTNGRVVFSLYVGETTSIKMIIPEIRRKKVKMAKGIKIPSADSIVCYQNISGVKNIFAVLQPQDIIVKEPSQLPGVISNLSNEYAILCRSINNIKTLSKKKQ